MTQLTLDAVRAESLKQAGLESHESPDRHFLTVMREAAITISSKSGFVTTDNLRVLADTLGVHPSSPNSWGAIFRGPKWKIVGRTKSAVASSHNREIKVWRWESE